MHSADLYSSNTCSGCGACSEICPKNAISMQPDNEGFIYPKINTELCVDCHKCIKSCPYKNVDAVSYPLLGYAGVSKDSNDLKISSSGGAFPAIAKRFIENGGSVIGAAMDFSPKFHVYHTAVNKYDDLEKIQGSKYVQSDMSGVYDKIKTLLNNGEKVLFSGTPCQVAGVYAVIGKNAKNLYTVDIVCHGVPNQKILLSYFESIEKNHDSKICDMTFRDKEYGWRKHGSIIFDNGKKVRLRCEDSSYYSFFMSGDLQRNNCYSCPFARGERIGDITLGDYWGIQKAHPELVQNNDESFKLESGVSAILVNSEKGNELLECYGNELRLIASTPEKIINGNTQLQRPLPKGFLRNITYRLYCKGSYRRVESLFKVVSVPHIIKSKISKVLK